MARPQLIAELSIEPNMALFATIERLTKVEHKILLIVENSRLRGVVTDYDLRQAILKKHPLETPIGTIINHNPVVVTEDTSEREIVALIRDTRCFQIPVVDASGKPVDIRFYEEFAYLSEHASERTAVVMAGGLGTRLRPMTEELPKPLLEVAGRPILFILLDQIISEGFNKIYVTLFYKSEIVIERVRDVARYRDVVEFVIEKEPLGTAGSLSLLPRRPENPFLVINADLLTEVPLREMLDFHSRERNDVTIALKRENFEVPYGVADVRDGRITALREKPEFAMDVNTGVYVVSPSAFDHIPTGTRFDMPQLVNELLKKDKPIGSFPIHEFWLDVGTHEQFNKAQLRFKDRVNSDR